MPPRNLAPKTLALIGGGVAALVVAGVLLLFNPFALGPNEMPSSIGDGEREDINETLEAFFFGVDQYNPQVASEVMLTPGELGIEEFTRMVYQFAVLQLAELTYGYSNLGAVTLDPAAGVAHAVAVTDMKNVEFTVARRDGNWRIVEVPDLPVPADRLPYTVETEVTSERVSEDGLTYTAIGELRNTGESTWLVLSLNAAMMSGSDVLRATTVAFVARPFVHPGESLPFRFDFTTSEAAALADATFEAFPGIRVARGADEDVLATSLTAEPAELDVAEAVDGFDVTLSNGEDATRVARLVVSVRDAVGRLIDVYSVPPAEVPAGRSTAVAVPGPAPDSVEGAAVVSVDVWGTAPTAASP